MPASAEVGQTGDGVEHGRPLASMETDLAEESRVAAFARKAASWLDGLNEVAKSSSQSTPALFAERLPLTEGTRAKMLEIVPWDSDHGYTTMLRHPRGKCKGVLHIACFDYSERGLHGKGSYAGSDAVRGNSCSKCGAVQPREAWTDRHCCGSSESLRFFWPAALQCSPAASQPRSPGSSAASRLASSKIRTSGSRRNLEKVKLL